ncbi:MAG: helix-turn-helix transcriptional regulator [Ruminococcus sp.]|nr:helix-turn-helix transcriptional regulator [Ruminococcus sp.]
MELQFSKNLTKYRKSCGMTQGQLAAKLNVTPQAVSKWENGSLPDSEFLPKLSVILGVSIDVLFGIKQEQPEQDIEQLITQKIRQTPAKERADLIMKFYYAAVSAYNEYTPTAAKYPENLELETYAELRTDNECSIARLNDDLKYCCFVKIPENGVDSYTEVCDNMIYLFQTLANKDTINIVHYLGSCYRNRMQSLEYISKQVDIPVKRVKRIMDNLDRLGIVWRVSADITDTPTIIYGYSHNTPLTCLLVIAKSISRYIRTHDLFIDAYSRGPFRSKSAEKSAPVPQADLWDNNNSIISEEE